MDRIAEPARTYLATGTRTAHVSYLGADGRPLAAPVWFALDGDAIVFATGRDTAKGKALRRDGRLTITVDQPTPPYSFIQVQGRAEFDERRDYVRWVTTACGRRYMGTDRADEFGARNADPDEIAVRVCPLRIVFNPDVTA